jgi:hypothetical protein
MVQVRLDPGLVEKAFGELGVRDGAAHQLQGGRASDLGVNGPVDFAHATFAQPVDDSIFANNRVYQ